MTSIPSEATSRRRKDFGIRQRLKPSLAASFKRLESCPTALSSPERPISPTMARSAATGVFLKLEAIAVATARSAAGSLIFRPPTTLTKMSWSESRNPTRLLSTAARRSNRLKSTPLAVRRGKPKLVVLARAWISTRRGRVPSKVTAMVEPAALGSRSAKNASDGLATSISPWLPISKTPTSEVGPKRFLTLRSKR